MDHRDITKYYKKLLMKNSKAKNRVNDKNVILVLFFIFR